MPEDSNRISRRDVLRTAGAAALIGAVTPAVAQEAKSGPGIRRIGPGKTPVAFELNGAMVQVEVEPRTTLLDAIRDHVGMTGTKRICDRGACGGCTVSLNGRTVNSCMMLAVDARGASVQTVEGLAEGDVLHPIQKAFIEQDATQCGFCTSGMLMSCAALLERTKKPTEKEIREAVSGNLCRCGTYPHVFRACREAAR
jgi:aerobic-type carbon monoxide dehydrogenase small subunit (CoxS/CutS family)